MPNATIKDVAREANVSIATVSRVLNNDKAVRAVTKKAVHDAMDRVNYTPNSVARSLKTNSTSIIAMLVSDISNSFFTAIAKSIEDYVCTYGYNMIVCSTDGQKEKEIEYLKMLKERHVDGIVLNTTNQNDSLIAQLSKEIPIVLSNRNITEPNFHGDFVDSDNITGMFDLTTHLIEHGHKKIGFIRGPVGLSTSEERLKGYCLAMKKIGCSEKGMEENIELADFTVNGGFEGTKAILERRKDLTALILSNNEMAVGSMQFLRERNISIPEDISLAAYGDIENMRIMFVQPSIVNMNSYIIGRKIAELIVERIDKKNSINNREFRYIPALIPGNGVKRL